MSQENVEMVGGCWSRSRGVDYTATDWDNEAIREMAERFWSPEIELRWRLVLDRERLPCESRADALDSPLAILGNQPSVDALIRHKILNPSLG